MSINDYEFIVYDDLLFRIFSLCDGLNLSKIYMVCKNWRKVVHMLIEIDFKFHTRSKITNASIRFLGNCENLKHLNLAHCVNLTDDGIEGIGRLTNLVSLNLNGNVKITGKSIKYISNCLKIEWLDLSGCVRIETLGFLYLSGLINLKSLRLAGCPNLTNKSLLFLHIISLEYFDLSHCLNITDSGLTSLKSHQNLQVLNLIGCNNMNNVLCSYISPTIKELYIESWRITDNFFMCIVNFELKKLYLKNTRSITDKSMQFMSQIKTLEQVILHNCISISNLGFAHLFQNRPEIKISMYDKNRGPLHYLITDTEVKMLHSHFSSGKEILVNAWNIFGITSAGNKLFCEIQGINRDWLCSKKTEESISDQIFKKRKRLEDALFMIGNYIKQTEIIKSDKYDNIKMNYDFVKNWFAENKGTIHEYDVCLDMLTDCCN